MQIAEISCIMTVKSVWRKRKNNYPPRLSLDILWGWS